jgi:hypothetical protein
MDRSVFVLFVAALSACASGPRTFSTRSAASLEAPAPPPLIVARAIVEEPPPPGQARDGWTGLASASPTDASHAHHHHTMTMPDGTTMEMPDAH